MKLTLVAILAFTCATAAMLSVVFTSTLARATAPDSLSQTAALPASTPVEVRRLLASPWNSTACSDIDPGLWKGRLATPDMSSDPLVQPLPGGVVPMPNACLPEHTSPATQTESLRLVNTVLP